MANREPIRESGWYGLTDHGWRRVVITHTDLEETTRTGWDLVHVPALRDQDTATMRGRQPSSE